MDDFKVDIKFPRAEDENPNLVSISGPEEHVLDCKDHLLNLEEEYLQVMKTLRNLPTSLNVLNLLII